jgi:SM-20-related protein
LENWLNLISLSIHIGTHFMTSLPKLQINPALNLEAAKARYAFQRRVHIPDFLAPTSAEHIYHLLSKNTPWGFAYHDGTTDRFMSMRDLEGLTRGRSERIAKVLQETVQKQGFAFGYHHFPLSLVSTSASGAHTEHEELHHFLSAETMLSLMRDISGKPDIMQAEIQADLFSALHFLGLHKGAQKHTTQIGFALTFTRNWHADWGGYLNFHAESGDIVQGIIPRFNCLTLFELPQNHSISLVPTSANEKLFMLRGLYHSG